MSIHVKSTIHAYFLHACVVCHGMFLAWYLLVACMAHTGADKYFCRAMDHLKHAERDQWKKAITERVKISKAMFHLDTAHCMGKNEVDVCMEICARAEDTLEDVDCDYLTDGDQGFYHTVQAKLFASTPHCQASDLSLAEHHAQTAKSIYIKCGFDERSREINDFLTSLTSRTSLDSCS